MNFKSCKSVQQHKELRKVCNINKTYVCPLEYGHIHSCDAFNSIKHKTYYVIKTAPVFTPVSLQIDASCAIDFFPPLKIKLFSCRKICNVLQPIIHLLNVCLHVLGMSIHVMHALLHINLFCLRAITLIMVVMEIAMPVMMAMVHNTHIVAYIRVCVFFLALESFMSQHNRA